MLHRNCQRWIGTVLFLSHLQTFANVNELPPTLPEQPHNVLEQNKELIPPKPPLTKKALEKLADKSASKYDLNPYLFRALVTHESNWNIDAVSPRNAIGLAQVQPATAAEICNLQTQELFDPEKNLDCGAKYFSELLEEFGFVELALCAYNAGPNRVKKHGECPADYTATHEYVQTVTETWRETLWRNVWVLDKWGYHLEDMFDFS